MQTFMPYADYKKSLDCLDNKRLGKQRVEAYQILRALIGESSGWRNHPATRMWSGYEYSLATYGVIACHLWRERGFKDSLLPKFKQYVIDLKSCGCLDKPYWIGDMRVHRSHRSNLMRKDAKFYRKYFRTVRNDLPYYWPTPEVSWID